jgi:hypothetical protein
MDYELVETRIHNEDSYFDLLVKYAKEGAEDILITITAINRGSESALVECTAPWIQKRLLKGERWRVPVGLCAKGRYTLFRLAIGFRV